MTVCIDIPLLLSSPEKKMPNTEPRIRANRQTMRIINIAIHPPAAIAAAMAFMPAFLAAIMSIALSPKLRRSSAFSFISSNAFSIGAG